MLVKVKFEQGAIR